MIAHLKGILTRKTPVQVIVDVRGVGYEVFIPLSTYCELPEPGETAALHIHTHLREDALKLYGFGTENEKKIFEILIGISKVGPKMALAILSGMPPTELMEAVRDHDISKLSLIPGVGPKTAERLALELKDKMAMIDIVTPASAPVGVDQGLLNDALSALVNLGYKKADAENALKHIWSANGKEASLEDLIKKSLNRLS